MGVISDRIDDYYAGAPRGRPSFSISAGVMGNPCNALLAFALRGFPDTPPPPHVKRIFRDGHRIEDDVLADLKSAGCTVLDRDPVTGSQYTYVALGGHIKSKADGLIQVNIGDPFHLLEIKSMNGDSFAQVKRLGVKYAMPKYYQQMVLEMGLSGIHTCMFVAYCKDNSRYHDELVAFDEHLWDVQRARIDIVLRNEARKVATGETDWRCKDCFKREACWSGAQVATACSTCAHASAQDGRSWWCQLWNKAAGTPCSDWRRYEPGPRV